MINPDLVYSAERRFLAHVGPRPVDLDQVRLLGCCGHYCPSATHRTEAESRNRLKGWDQATSRQRKIGGNQVNSWDEGECRHEWTSRNQVARSNKPFQISDHYHRASRGPVHRWV
jgi:hypothetical protein